LELLRKIAPSAKVIGYLVNPTNPSVEAETGDMHVAMRSLDLEFRDQHVRNARRSRLPSSALRSSGSTRSSLLQMCFSSSIVTSW
jgi:hypothetical protein